MSGPGFIDVHTHVVPETFPPYLSAAAAAMWPSTTEAHSCHKHVLVGGKHYRTVADGCWSASRRLTEMVDMGVARQALSPMPELLGYWLPLDDAKLLIRHINEQIASMVALDPSRLIGLGGVPLQDIDAALTELNYLVGTLKFAGVEIASHVNNVSIGDARFEPFFAEAARLGAAVFVHALHPAGKERLVGTFPEQAVCFPGDIALAAASMITGGIAARHPDLRIGFSQGGGALSVLLPRLEYTWRKMPKIGESLKESPATTARRFFYDSMVFDPDVLKLAIHSFGASQIFLGSDYPFAPVSWIDFGAELAEAGLDETTVQALSSDNALRFLGIT